MTRKTLKKKKNITGKIVLGIVLVIIIILSVIFAQSNKHTAIYDKSQDDTKWEKTEVEDELEVFQTFQAESSDITGVRVYTYHYGDKLEGSIIAELLDDNGKVLAKQTTDLNKVKDDKFTTFKFDDEVQVTKGSNYFIRIVQKSDKKGEGISFAYGKAYKDNMYKECSVTKNGTLIIQIMSHTFSIIRFLISLIVLAFLFVAGFYLYKMNIIKKRRKRKK